MRFSIIVLTYNSIFDEIKYSLNSILNQVDIEYEIIIADDGSEENHESQIINFFQSKKFFNYIITNTKDNVGTVRNSLNGIEKASGEIVKLLGAGDCLYSEKTLYRVAEKMSYVNCVCCFGDLIGYSFGKDGEIQLSNFNHPRDMNVYQEGMSNKQKFKNIIAFEDWISGASMFFKKQYLLIYLKNMKGYVKYCEDLVTAELALNNIYFEYMEFPVVWYKMGDGISTQDNAYFKDMLKRDHDNYWKYLEDKYSNKLLKCYNYKRKIRKKKSKVFYYLINPQKFFFEIKVKIQHRKSHSLSDEFLCKIISEAE